MIKIKLALILIGLALAGSLPQARAQADTVTINLKAYQQGPQTAVGTNVTKFNVSTTTFSTATLLNLIAGFIGTNFPAGAKLVMVDYNSFRVVAADGATLVDLDTGLIKAEYGAYPTAGTYNSQTDQSKYRYVYMLTVTFDAGSDNNFVLHGFVTENYAFSKANIRGERVITDSFQMTASGEGKLNGTSAIFNGKVTGRGRAVTL